jgi:GDPmannose 4,6-dehydratase
MKKALICGVSGQDGAFLAKLLLDKGYKVYGASRDAQINSFGNLTRLGLGERVSLASVTLNDFRSVLQALMKIQPDEVYNLAGQSSVGLSFEQPVETMESISIGTLNLLEAIRFSGQPIRFYNAGSSECFGDTNGEAADEKTAFAPRSPYAVAKSAAFWEVANYREAYNLFACTGILFNHESYLRPERFVTRKIVSAAVRIAAGSNEKLHLGNIDIKRDWGWAPEYVKAMWLMLQQDQADDFVIATGVANSLRSFVASTFEAVGLDWNEHVVIDQQLIRPSEISANRGDPSKAARLLGWKPGLFMPEVVQLMVAAELNKGPDEAVDRRAPA